MKLSLLLTLTLSMSLGFGQATAAQLTNAQKQFVDSYVKLLMQLDSTQSPELLSALTIKKIQSQGTSSVDSDVMLFLDLEKTAGNSERVRKIRDYLEARGIDPRLADSMAQTKYSWIVADKGYECKRDCILVVTTLPAKSVDEMGEVLAGMKVLSPHSGYIVSGINSFYGQELLTNQFKNKDLIARSYAEVLTERDSRKSFNENYSSINDEMNHRGFIDGLIKPMLVSRYLFDKQGEGQTVDGIDRLMNRYHLKNDFSIFPQNDLRMNENGLGNNLQGRLDKFSNQMQSDDSLTVGKVAKGMSDHYINSKIEDMVGRSPEKLSQEAKNAKTVGEATVLMGSIFIHTATEVAKSAISAMPEGSLLKNGLDFYENGKRFNNISGDQRKSDGQIEAERQEQERKEREQKEKDDQIKKDQEEKDAQAKKDQEEKDKKAKEEQAKKDKQEKDNAPKDRPERSTPPTENNHVKGEQYVSPNILTANPDLNIDKVTLTPEEAAKQAKIKHNSVILTTHSGDDAKEDTVFFVYNKGANPMNSTPALGFDPREQIDLEAQIQAKKGMVSTPGLYLSEPRSGATPRPVNTNALIRK